MNKSEKIQVVLKIKKKYSAELVTRIVSDKKISANEIKIRWLKNSIKLIFRA